MTQIELIEAIQTIDLRHRVLRPNQEPEACRYPQDNEPTTFHIGAVSNGRIISVASFHTESFPHLSGKNPYRLRGMATEPEFQGHGVGRLVLQRGFEELRRCMCDLLWCNARVAAFPFYEKMGFLYYGDFFEIPAIGPHKVMYTYLNKA